MRLRTLVDLPDNRERRRHNRYTLSHPLAVRIEEAGQRMEGHIVEVSLSGCRLAVASGEPPSQDCDLHFPGASTVRCKLSWHEKNQAGFCFVDQAVGLEFFARCMKAMLPQTL